MPSPINTPHASRPNLKVLKFGGTSVGSLSAFRRSLDLIQASSQDARLIVVVSALSGVTDRLVAATQDPGLNRLTLLQELRARHFDLAAVLLDEQRLARFEHRLDTVLVRLWRALDPPNLLTPGRSDEVLATGERLSAPLLALALEQRGLPAAAHDAAALIRTDDTFGQATVDRETTRRHIQAWYAQQQPGEIAVVTGFIGATSSGQTTTLGRSGSDYSAALLASALDAGTLERWTDVDGLFSEDPRTHAEAQRLPVMTLEEAHSRAGMNRLGMHADAFAPLFGAGIPLHVRSTRYPDRGTKILPHCPGSEALAC